MDAATISLLTGKFILGMLLLSRVSGLMVSAPFFKSDAIPMQMKIILTIILATIMTQTFWKDQPAIDFHLWYMALLVMKEFFVGLIIGFSVNAVFWAARFAGGLLDFEMGYQTAILFNSDDTPTMLGELNEMITLMIFIFINGHHFLIEGLYASVRAIPLTKFEITESTITLLTRLSTTILMIGIKMAAPVLVALFLTTLGLVLLARVAPQTNIFILSFQLKIVVGLLVLITSFPLFVMVTKYALQSMESEVMKIILSMNPARV
jgi:flagellar biosynthetic protein FliR